jgi:hypothetical protein
MSLHEVITGSRLRPEQIKVTQEGCLHCEKTGEEVISVQIRNNAQALISELAAQNGLNCKTLISAALSHFLDHIEKDGRFYIKPQRAYRHRKAPGIMTDQL